MDIEQLIAGFRELELDHEPDGWPAVQMSKISALCDAVESAIPALDLLQTHLDDGAVITQRQDSLWWLQDKNGVGICNGATIRKMLVNLIFTEC